MKSRQPFEEIIPQMKNNAYEYIMKYMNKGGKMMMSRNCPTFVKGAVQKKHLLGPINEDETTFLMAQDAEVVLESGEVVQLECEEMRKARQERKGSAKNALSPARASVDELKKKRKAEAEESVVSDATTEETAQKDIDKQNNVRYNKPQGRYSVNKTPYIQWKSDALSWANSKKTKSGDMNSGADANYYYVYEAVDGYDEGKANDYKVVAKIPSNNQQLIDQWEEEVRKKNERNHTEGSDSILYESAYECKRAISQYQGNNANVLGQSTANVGVGGMARKQSKSNGKRNTEEGSGNQRGLKGGRASLAVDSAGNTLTKEQAEYFKDSKVRDKDGNLLIVYHGTRKADFTEFKRNVNYFTDSSEMADSYAPSSEKYVGYLDIKKPFIVDAKGEKWSRVPIDAKTKEFLEKYGASTFKENGKWRTSPADIASAIESGIDEGTLDYDGIIIKNIDDIITASPSICNKKSQKCAKKMGERKFL